MRSATFGSTNGASWRLIVGGTRHNLGETLRERLGDFFGVLGTQTPEALTHERPPFSAIEATITSRYFSHSSTQSSPMTTLL